MTPFQALYGYRPSQLTLSPTQTLVAAVEDWSRERVNWNTLLKENLLQAQNRMKQLADKGRTDRKFEEGDWVYLKLQPYRQSSVALRRNLKLSARYYGPYQVEQKVGSVAYKLKLPDGCSVHPVFHVSLLKKSANGSQIHPTPPEATAEGEFKVAPKAILDKRVIYRKGQEVEQVLIEWENLNKDDSTWEDWSFIRVQFPELNPRD
ncbi:uncharacterized protein [Coffea arabica]|uniref:Chromo domain-containing protein n=1 Tax=Coffea arabica TaxID=13443 RepID=A0A6P6S3S2_COFAR|nr:uncharacterized protein LOC113687420 [Coffea arabica]